MRPDRCSDIDTPAMVDEDPLYASGSFCFGQQVGHQNTCRYNRVFNQLVDFNRFFNLTSYSVVASGVLSLWVTGGVGLATVLPFALAAAFAWRAEATGLQLSGKVGTASAVALLPACFAAWKMGWLGGEAGGIALAGFLGQLIIVLSVIKLLQKKSDRDWVFLYLMSFFEVLLAAGISISPVYIVSLFIFLMCAASAVVTFEMRRSAATANRFFDGVGKSIARVPIAASLITVLALLLSVPVFFTLPRGSGSFLSSASGLATRTGFADSVRLGEIGKIQQSEEVVMRVQVEGLEEGAPPLRWRGVTLDLFDNRVWRSSRPFTDPPYTKGDRDYFLVNFASGKGGLVTQSFYLEPLDTPVLFALGRPVVVSGGFELVLKNSDDALKFQRKSFERVSYKVLSDPYLPATDRLEGDAVDYPASAARFLQLPTDLDPRIGELAKGVIDRAGPVGRYGKAAAIEKYLQESFGYTLEMKAGGNQPVADFLFNVREGHCEYFASSMALMLRTQGIAARVVNGFQQGEYNDAADVFVVRQRDAHSWVEVFFPGENTWVPFDPTPAAGRIGAGNSGLMGGLAKYAEALETLWIQYFVAYGNEEQESLFRSVRTGVTDYQATAVERLSSIGERVKSVWNDFYTWVWTREAADTIVSPVRLSVVLLLIVILSGVVVRVLKGRTLWNWWKRVSGTHRAGSVIEFHSRMVSILARRGLLRESSQTPLEFARSSGLPEAVLITEQYHRVRFGSCTLSAAEMSEIETCLRRLEERPA